MNWRETFFPRGMLRKRQRQFAVDRSQVRQSDDEFIAITCPNEDTKFKECVVMLRQMIAQRCNCSPTLLLASDSTSNIHKVMGETSFLGWAFTLGDLGPDETFFFALENEYRRVTGQVSYFDPASRYRLADDWCKGRNLGDWASDVVRKMRKWQRPSEEEARATLGSRKLTTK